MLFLYTVVIWQRLTIMSNYSLKISLLAQYKTKSDIKVPIYLIDINNQRYIMYLKDFDASNFNEFAELDELRPVPYPIIQEETIVETLYNCDNDKFAIKFNGVSYIVMKDKHDTIPVYELKEKSLDFTKFIDNKVKKHNKKKMGLTFERNVVSYHQYPVQYYHSPILQPSQPIIYTQEQPYIYITPPFTYQYPQPVYTNEVMSNINI